MLRKVIIKNLTPIIWNISNEKKALAMLEFSTIERDSGNQILCALNLNKDPEIKAHLFQHVLEEYFHADLFVGLTEKYSNKMLIKQIIKREIIISKVSTSDEINDFFAYAHVGEESVNKDFSHYAEAKRIDSKISNIFKRVAEDENNHIHSTADILLKMVNENKFICSWLIVKSYIKRNIKIYKRYVNSIGLKILEILLAIVYFVVGYFTHKKIQLRFDAITSDEIVNSIKQNQLELTKR